MYNFTNKGIVGRLNYDYLSKYIFSFSFRYDGSSKFGPGHQWGFFPVVTAGWRLSEENFFKNNASLSFINNIKIRGTYGVVGDDSAAAYQYLSGYEYPFNIGYRGGGGYIINGEYINSVNPTTIPNKEITWFTAHTINVGLDVEMWKGKLGMVAEVFQRDRKGLLTKSLTVVLPNEAGIDVPEENLNKDRTLGLEITLTHRNKIRDFRYNISSYVAMDRTKVIYVERVPDTNSANNWKNNATGRWGEFYSSGGQQLARMDSFWGYDYLGQFQSFDEFLSPGSVIYDGAGNLHLLPGDLIYGDYNKDGVIDGNDTHPIAIRHPALSYGFTLGGEWKGIDLNFTFQGTAMNRKRLGEITGHFEVPIGGDTSGLQVFADRWHRADPYSTEEGPRDGSGWVAGKYPSVFTQNDRDFITANSNFWIVKADYLRLKTIEIGYTIPNHLTKKIGVTNARIFLNGYNLFTITEMKIADPEQSAGYPLNSTYNAGINVSF
jgi:TonB-linked SusC/RagA family outer membrane protein